MLKLCLRLALTALLFSSAIFTSAQLRIVSVGAYTGITSTYTWDEGILADPRYKARYDLKLSAFGLTYGVDYEGFGFVLSPGFLSTGQNYFIVNTVGGHEGLRKINLNYVTLPVGGKIHLIDLTFLKTSLIIGGSAGYLIKGSEVISHNRAKLYFPPVVYPILPADYTVEYDGVLTPDVQGLEMLKKSDFNPIQFFGFAGISSDWYFSENMKVTFDVRINYTFQDNRSDAYLKKLNTYQTIYDIPGKRRDIIGNFTIGISRYLEIEKKEKDRNLHGKSNTKKYMPPKRIPGPKKSKPRN